MSTSTLPAARTSNRTGLHPLRLWHLLSLDAPTVAAVWTCFAARTACSAGSSSCPLSAGSRSGAPTAMFLAVWVLYLGDRLLDSRSPASVRASSSLSTAVVAAGHLEPRHLFHDAHRTPLTVLAAAATITLIPLIPHSFALRALGLYLALGAVLLVWLALIHLRAFTTRSGKPLPKEVAVGLFFSAAVFIPVLAANPRPFLAPAGFFALLCALNCVFIYAWEHPSAHAAHPTAHAAHPTTRAALRFRLPLTLACIAGPLATIPLDGAATPLFVAIALAAALLLGLGRLRARLHPTTLRAAADLVLLTPLLLLGCSGGRV